MSVIPALFYKLQVEVHLRMREICQKICVTQKNNNFNTQHSINILYFIVIIVKKYGEKWYQLLYNVPRISRYCKNKMLRSDWLIYKFAYIYLNTNLSCYLKTDFDGFLYKESDSEVRFGLTGFLKKFDGPCNISMPSYGSRDHKFENMRQ